MTAGFERAMLNLKLRTEDMASTMQTVFENAFQSIEDQFVSFMTGDGFDLHGLFKGITADLSRASFRAMMDPLLGGIGQQFGIPGFGTKGGGLFGQGGPTGTMLDPINVAIVGGAGLPGLGGLPGVGQAGITGVGANPLSGLFSGIKSMFSGIGSGLSGLFGGMGGLGGLIGGIGSLFGFANGGGFEVGGSGGTDSQLVAFKATPGEDVIVRTPEQQAAMAEGQGNPNVSLDTKIVNVFDPGAMMDAMRTPAGERAILNIVQSNPEAFKRALSV